MRKEERRVFSDINFCVESRKAVLVSCHGQAIQNYFIVFKVAMIGLKLQQNRHSRWLGRKEKQPGDGVKAEGDRKGK